MPKTKKKIKAWLVLDVNKKVRHPSVSIFDTKKEAQKECKSLNELPDPTDVKDPKNYVVPCEITY